MNQWKEYKIEQIDDLVKKAIKLLQQNDPDFLDPHFDINERSVTHRLGMYLATLFPEEDVDCEYNRKYDDGSSEYISKNIDLPKIDKGITTKDIEAKTVYPDIIIHKRKEERNLLALEVKMSWKNSKGNFDLIKAQAYKYGLKYDFSGYLVLGPQDKYELKWI